MGQTTSNPVAAAGVTGWRFRLAVATALVASVVVAGFFYVEVRRAARPRNVLDQPLGTHRVRGVEESGFYGTESIPETGEEFRWTNGSARLTVPVADVPPTALNVRLNVPRPTRLSVRVNGDSLFDEPVKPRPDWTRTFDLAGLAAGQPVTVEVLSDAFVPSMVAPGNKDDRALGVCVRGVTLVSRDRDYRGVVLGAEEVAGVEESGFHGAEGCGGRPCRWTNGRARLVVPVPADRRPRALAVTAEVPDRADFRVRVTVNGRAVFDDAVPAKATWAKEIPLDGVEFPGRAEIELVTPAVVPAQVDPRSKDTRPLGLRVRKIVLLGD